MTDRGRQANHEVLIAFRLEPARFGLPIERVREIVRAVAVTPLPGAPPIVEGVLDYRGRRLVPVLDPRKRAGLPPVELHPDQHFIVAEAGTRWVALRVDRVEGVVEVSRLAIEQAVAAIPAAPYVAGLARLPDGLLVIYDLARFLSLDEMQRLDHAIRQAGSSSAAAGASPR